MTDGITLSRRGLLGTGLAFTFSFAGPGTAEAQSAPSGPADLNAYVRIAPDGTITIQAPVPEMGQASNTALPLIVAEELDADWSKVRIETAPVRPAYDSPVFRSQFVVASLSVRGYWMPLRIAGAQARRVLLDAVAARWGVPVDQLTTEPSVVVHAASNRRIGYGEVAAFATVPATLPEIAPAALKPVSAFRLVGRDVPRFDVPAKATGQAVFAIDVRLPGMLHATVARSPGLGARPLTHNGAALLARPGITHVLPLDQGVAIVGERVEAVLAARRELAVTWTPGEGASHSSEPALASYLADARDTAKAGVAVVRAGEAVQAIAGAARVHTAEFTSDYVYHAQMEPLTCVAHVTADAAEVWAGTQWPSLVRDEAAKIAGIPADRVKVNMLTMGGGFGRRAAIDYAIEAVTIAKAVGRPVKVMATREDDIANAHVRPMTAHRIDVGLDAAGRITGWRHRLAADLVVPMLYGRARLDAQRGVDHIVTYHANVAHYDVPAALTEHVYREHGVRTAPWRGIGAGPNAFAVEAVIDDLARQANADPLAYRLALLKDARAKAVLEAAGAMAEWGRRREGTSLGIGFAKLGLPQLGEALSATVAEVAVDRANGQIRVLRLWCAADIGLPVQPRNAMRQIEASLLWGVSSALTERLTFRDGAVEQTNFSDYEVLRASDTPQVQVRLIRSGEMPLPAAELGLGTVAPAISNAVLAATGRRLSAMPFTRDRVRAALAT
ncbi:MAG: molybdopterin-dependent oxidoreductase [Roseomonas sp.]|nr:molybdopterin-dependent oxidoreductase [Roseomonas sp.]